MVHIVDLGTIAPDTATSSLLWIAENLRASDVADIAATSGRDPVTAITKAVEASEWSALILEDGLPVAAMGAMPVEGLPEQNVGFWLLATPAYAAAEATAGPAVAASLERLPADRSILWAGATAGNDDARRTLETLGFAEVAHAAHPCSGVEIVSYLSVAGIAGKAS